MLCKLKEERKRRRVISTLFRNFFTCISFSRVKFNFRVISLFYGETQHKLLPFPHIPYSPTVKAIKSCFYDPKNLNFIPKTLINTHIINTQPKTSYLWKFEFFPIS